jgi:hypothetical protein
VPDPHLDIYSSQPCHGLIVLGGASSFTPIEVRSLFGPDPPQEVSPNTISLPVLLTRILTKRRKQGLRKRRTLKMCFVYDQLRLRPLRWILEVLPFIVRSQLRCVLCHFIVPSHDSVHSPGLAPSRRIQDEHHERVKVHRTVKTRMEASYPKGYPKSKRYSPKAHVKVEPM